MLAEEHRVVADGNLPNCEAVAQWLTDDDLGPVDPAAHVESHMGLTQLVWLSAVTPRLTAVRCACM